MSYKQCRTEQSSARQRQLEEGLLGAMLNQRFEDISVSDLCDQMHVPRKSFYRYFTSKEGALHALVDHRLLEYESNPEQYGAASGELGRIAGFYEYWRGQKPLLDALAKSGLSQVLVERAVQSQEDSLVFRFRERPENREFREFTRIFVGCGVMSAVIRWHHEGYRQTPAEMAEMTYRLLSKPLAW